MFEKIILETQAADGIIRKEIQHEQVRTQNFIDGKPGYITTRDIKRLGYADTADLIRHLKEQGYIEVND